MFTGIVEEMGTVVSLEESDDMVLWDGSKGTGTQLTVAANVVLEGAYLGYAVYCVVTIVVYYLFVRSLIHGINPLFQLQHLCQRCLLDGDGIARWPVHRGIGS